MYICWYRQYANSKNARNVYHIKFDFQHLRSNTEKTGIRPTRDSHLYYSTADSYVPCHPKSNFHQWNLWRGYHCHHFCEKSNWMTGLTCLKEKGTAGRWRLLGVSIYETPFRVNSIRAVTAVDVSSTLRLPATSLSDWQPAWYKLVWRCYPEQVQGTPLKTNFNFALPVSLIWIPFVF